MCLTHSYGHLLDLPYGVLDYWLCSLLTDCTVGVLGEFASGHVFVEACKLRFASAVSLYVLSLLDCCPNSVGVKGGGQFGLSNTSVLYLL